MPKPPITTFSSVLITKSDTSANNGLYAPKLTTVQRNHIPANVLRNGVIIFNTDDELYQVNINNSWINVYTTPEENGNLVVLSSDTDPTTDMPGSIYYNTVSNVFKFRNDAEWIELDNGGGDVAGPGVSVAGNIATFSDTTGKVIEDSNVSILKVPAVSLNSKQPNVDVNEISNIGHIKFNGDVGLIFVDSLMPLEFINNSLSGGDSQVCSLFTGGLPTSSSSPSALVEISSTTGGLVLSRMSNSQVNALISPSPGMLVYNYDFLQCMLYSQGAWERIVTIKSSGTIDANNARITSLTSPINNNDGTNKLYVDSRTWTTSQITNFNTAVTAFRLDQFAVPNTSVNFNSQELTNVATPASGTSAANKLYVDNRTVTLSGAVTGTAGINSTIVTTLTDITVSQITNFNTAVTAFRLDQFAVPTASVNFNSQELTNVATPSSGTSAVNRDYITTALASYVAGPASSTSNNVTTYDGTTGKIIKDSGIPIANVYSAGNPTYLKDTASTSNNSFFAGTLAGNLSFTGVSNTGVGINCMPVITTAAQNTALGHNSSNSALTCTGTTAIGFSSLFTNNADFNTAVGYRAGYSTTSGNLNSFYGKDSGYSNTSGNTCCFYGQESGFSSINPIACNFYGFSAGYSNVSGSYNCYYGLNSGFSAISTSGNTAYGTFSLYANLGSGNCAFGDQAGAAQALYTNSVFIGAGADASVTGLSNACALGYIARVGVSNAISIGYQFAGIGKNSPAYALHIGTENGVTPLLYMASTSVPTAPATANDCIYSVSSGKPTFTSGTAIHSGTAVVAKENITVGFVTLNGTTGVTVSTTAIQSSSRIFVYHSAGAGTPSFGTVGVLITGNVIFGTSFKIFSTNATDTNFAFWQIINP